MKLNIQDTFNQLLPADPNEQNYPRQVSEACFSYVTPKQPGNPTLLHVSQEMLDELGISSAEAESEAFRDLVTGKSVMPNTKPYAMCYGGHQFGNWAGQLGDGRAINLMEVVYKEKRWSLQLKGAGETPYSRTADGLAVLRSSIREHLCSEAMFHLGGPTTRSLSLSLSGDQVFRDMLYDGNGDYEKGAIVCRVAPSFIRFGNFQIFASRRDLPNLKKLTDYTIQHFFPEIKNLDKAGYYQFFNTVLDRTLKMVIEWQRVGFVHGVMNTDNMSILGLTIDYGPYGWLEGYEKGWTPNTTDKRHKRYQFGNQPSIALWNLYQLANAIYPLVEDPKPLEAALELYKIDYTKAKLAMMRAKLGLQETDENDTNLITALEVALEQTETDMTIFFRLLANVEATDSVDTIIKKIELAFYQREALTGEILKHWTMWLEAYKATRY